MDFWRAAEILLRRGKFIALSVLVTCTLVYGMIKLTGSNWLATVRFGPSPTASLPADKDQPADEGSDAEAVAPGQGQATYYEALAKSPDVLQPALNKLGQQVQADAVLANIKVKATAPRVYELQVQDKNPEHASVVANALAENLVSRNRVLYTQQAQSNVSFLQTALQKSQSELNRIRNQISAYKVQHGLLSGSSDDLQLGMNRLQQAYRDRDDIAGKLAYAQSKLSMSEAQLRSMPRTIAISESPKDNPVIKSLQDELGKAEAELTKLSARYTDENINVQIARATRDDLKNRLNQALKENAQASMPQANPHVGPLEQAVAELRQDISGYSSQLATLNATIQTAQSSVQASGGPYGPLGALTAEFTSKNEEISGIKSRLNRAQMALDAAERQNPLNIITRVEALNPPVNVTPGRTKKLLFIAFFLSLVLSSGIVLANDLLDRRVKSVSDAEIMLPFPVSAAIPLPQSALSAPQLARITEIAPQSLSSEAYHFLALRLLNGNDQRVRSAMVVSAKAGQGTTQTVTNLGITLAQAGYRVVIVDANFRTPQIHTLFGLPNDFGFTNLLEEPEVSLGHVLHDTNVEHLRVLRTEKKKAEAQLLMALHPTPVENLHVITSGKPPANPWELFRSRNLKEISTRLEEFADFILYDTPSALAFTDAMNLTPIADGAFLCLRALETPSGAEERLVDALKQANVVNLGMVLTDVPAEMLDSYANYQHYYPTPAPSGSLKNSVPKPGGYPQLQGPATPPPTIIDVQPSDPNAGGWNDYVVEGEGRESTAS